MSIEDEWACASLSSKYALYADRARHRVPDLFAEDAVLVLPGHEMRGREEIRKWFAPRPKVATLHFCTNTVIELLDADHARGSTHLPVARPRSGRGDHHIPPAHAGAAHRRHLFRHVRAGERQVALQLPPPRGGLQGAPVSADSRRTDAGAGQPAGRPAQSLVVIAAPRLNPRDPQLGRTCGRAASRGSSARARGLRLRRSERQAHMTDIESLLGAMTLEEKIGQLTMASAGFAVTGPVLAEA